MGKNSNVHKSRATLAEDLRKERELEAKKALKRQRREAAAAEQAGEMITDSSSAAAAIPVSRAALAPEVGPRGPSKFGKVKVGKKKIKIVGGPAGITKSITNTKKSRGIRKPSSVMRKTLKKMAKKRDGMEL